jgi:hypothetical protein
MGNLSNFERGQNTGMHLAGASVTKIPIVLDVLIAKVSKVMSAYTNHEKTTSAKRNSGGKSTLTERNCCILRTVPKNHRPTTAELNMHLERPCFHKNCPM